MLKWIKDVILYFNQSGVPVPLARDNKSPSVSLTLLIISSIFVMLGLLSLTVPWLQVSFLGVFVVVRYMRGTIP